MISVVISTLGRPSLSHCLAALVSEKGDFEVVVVNQGTFPLNIPRDPHFRIIDCKSLGLAAGRNVGVGDAKGDFISFIDDDAVPKAGYISFLQSIYQRKGPNIMVAGAIVTMDDGAPYNRFHDHVPRRLTSSDWMCFMGGNFAVAKSVFQRIGLFDERFGVGRNWGAGEETDLFLRAQYHDIFSCYEPSIVVSHPPEPLANPTEDFYRKMRLYAKGHGALFAKHLLQYGKMGMLFELALSLLKPLVRMSQYLAVLKIPQFRIYKCLLVGRLSGFWEYLRD